MPRNITATLALGLALSACRPPRDPIASTAPSATPSATAGPLARSVSLIEERFGLTLADPYRWMEGDVNPEADAWIRAQGHHAEAWLARVAGRAALRDQLERADHGRDDVSDLRLAGGRQFYLRRHADAELPALMVREADGAVRAVATSPTATTSPIAIQSYAPSPDGRRVAYNLTSGGDERATIVVVDVDRREVVRAGLGPTWGDAPVQWLPDSSGFFYVQLAEAVVGVDPLLHSTVRLHVVGAPAGSDRELLTGSTPGFALAAEEFGQVTTAPGSAWVVARATLPRSEERIAVAPLAALTRGGAVPWRVVATYEDEVAPAFVHGDRLYLLAWKGSPNGRLLSVPLASPDLATARLELAEDPEAVLTATSAARDGLYYVRTRAGSSQLGRVSWSGATTSIALPEPGKIYGIETDPARDGATFYLSSWIRPRQYYVYAPEAQALTPIELGARVPASEPRYVVEQVEVRSGDGAAVPMTILRRRDLPRDGSPPAILVGYGAYGISIDPWFEAESLVWLERGGVLAYAHVRGGGEKGRRWYVAGKGPHKAKGVADFVACAEHLIAHGYTRATRLAAQGGSMGGLLVGMAITTRPELFAAAHLRDGEVNPLRMMHAANGAAQQSELGDPETEAGYRQIAAMDPYHHVRDGQRYPATIVTVGLNDQRVAPWMSAKLVARLRAARPDGAPVLLRVDDRGGHGQGATRAQELALTADVWSFFLAAAGEPGFAPTPPLTDQGTAR